MFGAAIAFVAAFLLTWPALIVLFLAGVLFEHNECHGWAVTSMLALAAVSYFFFSIPLLTVAVGSVLYVVAGLVWSFYRYKRYADKVVKENANKTDSEKKYALQQLHPKEMLGTITSWIIIWPFSVLENFVGDIINAIQTLVEKVFKSVYHRIYNSAVSALNVKL